MVTEVYKWSNGMVMVFDECGQQMTEYQGRYPDVRDKILAAAPPSCVFWRAIWGELREPIGREEF